MASQTKTQAIPWETSLRYDLAVIGLVLLALLAGWVLKAAMEEERTIFTDVDANLSLRYPASWVPQTEKGTLLSISDLQSEGSFKVTFSVSVRELDPEDVKPVQELVVPFTVERGQELTGYRVLEIGGTEVDRLEAASITYGFVADPITSPLQTRLPVVVQAMDILVIHGNNLYVFTFAAPAATFAQHAGTMEAILNSVDLKG